MSWLELLSGVAAAFGAVYAVRAVIPGTSSEINAISWITCGVAAGAVGYFFFGNTTIDLDTVTLYLVEGGAGIGLWHAWWRYFIGKQ